MNKKAMALIPPTLLIIVVILTIVSTASKDSSELDTQNYSEQIDPAIVRNINIIWPTGSISILASDNDFISVSNNELTDFTDWGLDGNELVIPHREKTTEGENLVVSVPKYWMGNNISVKCVSSSIFMSSVLGNQIRIENESGDCYFNNCVFDTLKIDKISGDVLYGGDLNITECHVVSSNCDFSLSSNPSKILFHSESGNAAFAIPAECGFMLRKELQNGIFTTDFTLSEEDGMLLHGDLGGSFEFKSISGNLEICKNKQ